MILALDIIDIDAEDQREINKRTEKNERKLIFYGIKFWGNHDKDKLKIMKYNG